MARGWAQAAEWRRCMSQAGMPAACAHAGFASPKPRTDRQASGRRRQPRTLTQGETSARLDSGCKGGTGGKTLAGSVARIGWDGMELERIDGILVWGGKQGRVGCPRAQLGQRPRGRQLSRQSKLLLVAVCFALLVAGVLRQGPQHSRTLAVLTWVLHRVPSAQRITVLPCGGGRCSSIRAQGAQRIRATGRQWRWRASTGAVHSCGCCQRCGTLAGSSRARKLPLRASPGRSCGCPRTPAGKIAREVSLHECQAQP